MKFCWILYAKWNIRQINFNCVFVSALATPNSYILFPHWQHNWHPYRQLASCYISEMITLRFAGWISGRIVSLQPDPDIQKLLSNGNRIRIRISETLLSIFRGFRLLEKVAHCTIIHSLFSEASFQPSVPWLRVCLWYNLCSVISFPLLICYLDMPNLLAWICSWCVKIGLFQYTLRTLFAVYLD